MARISVLVFMCVLIAVTLAAEEDGAKKTETNTESSTDLDTADTFGILSGHGRGFQHRRRYIHHGGPGYGYGHGYYRSFGHGYGHGYGHHRGYYPHYYTTTYYPTYHYGHHQYHYGHGHGHRRGLFG